MTVETIVTAPLGVAGEYPSHKAELAKGGFHIVATIADRDALWDALKTRTMIVHVLQNEDGDSKTYLWNGTSWSEHELSTQSLPVAGVTFVMPDGSTVSGVELLGLDGLTLEGNAKDGFTLKASASASGSLKLSHDGKDYTANTIVISPNLELNTTNKAGVIEIGIPPMKYELRKTTGYLAYVQYPELVYGKAKEGVKYRKGSIWPDLVQVSAEGMLQIDRDNKAFGLQDTTADDPNVTGGSRFLVWPFIYLEGDAPDDGYVELIWYKKSDGSIAVDDNGHPLAVRHNYKRGQPLTPKHAPIMLAQVMSAKGLTEYSLALVDNFDEYVKVVGYSEGPSGICIQELSDKGMSSAALVQAEVDTGFSVRPERYYVGTYLSTIGYLTTIPEAAQRITAGSRANTVAGVEMYAITDCMFGVVDGSIQVSAYNGGVTDFYIGLEIGQDVARLVAGKELEAAAAIIDKDDAWRVGFFSYTGDLDKRPPIYSSRNNESLVLNAGWTEYASSFISEDAVSGLHSFNSAVGTPVPANADFVMVAIYPVSAQSPCDLTLKAFHADASKPFTGYEVNTIGIQGLQHLDFMSETVRLVQGIGTKDADGKILNNFASLRYTDNTGSIPMPLGVPERKLAYLTLDKSLNVIAGSSAQGGEGALVASEHVEVTIYQTWQLYNELDASHTAEYWLEVFRDSTGQATEVPHSRTEFTVDSKRQGVDYFTTNKVTVTLDAGDYIYARCSSDVKDGAYAQTNQQSKPLCITYITEKYLG